MSEYMDNQMILLKKLFKKFNCHFATGFHNLLWQLMINEVHADNIVCLIPVWSSANGQTIDIGLADVTGGYYQTSCAINFNPKYGNLDPQDSIELILEKLNRSIFGYAPKAVDKIQILSLKNGGENEPTTS